MFDQLMDLLDREKRPGEKKRVGLRGLIDRIGADNDEHYRENSRERRHHEDDDYDDRHRDSRRRERNDFDFD